MSITTVKFTESSRMEQPVSAIGWLDTLVMRYPRWKRAIVAFVASCVGALAAGYLIGMFLNALMVGAYIFTGSMFLVYMIYIMGLLIAMYVGSKVGKFISDAVMDDALGKKMEAIASSTKNKVTGWFSKSKVEVMP